MVVLLVIDQLPQWAFIAKRSHLSGGFDRLLREGEWHTGEHPTPATSTAPGHALLGSGEPPSASGIIANEWWDRDEQKLVTSVEDPAGGKSAVRLRVPGLGDAIAAANSGAKAVGISLKDRAAILPLGHAGLSIWYDDKQVAFTSIGASSISSGSTSKGAAWLTAYNAAHPISAHLKDVWTPLDRTPGLAGVADDRSGEVGEEGLGATFPHDLSAVKDPAEALYAMPVGNQLVLDLAAEAIDREQLGADPTPDLLVVSLSVNDIVGHGWGHESWESWDEMLRLDEAIGKFLAQLDQKVGAGKWAMIATSDHGAAPMPSTGKMTYEQIQEAANNAAQAELGPGQWVASAKYPNIYLTAAARAANDHDRSYAIKKILFALHSFPGIAMVDRTEQFAGHCETRTGEAFRICQMLDVERSGDIFYLQQRGWVLEKVDERFATAHGSPYEYDSEVPVIMLPPGRVVHEPLAKPSETKIKMIRISTILARWLGVTPPISMPRPTATSH